MERIGNIFVYPIDMKGRGKALVMPCIEGYTVYVDINLSHSQMVDACRKELDHIEDNDFEKDSANLAETENHR